MSALATATDVADRLGRDLTDAETIQAEQAITTTTGLIAGVASLTIAGVEALTPRPTYLSGLCVEKAVGVIVNPHGLASQSEQLGAYQHSETYPRVADIGIFLSRTERRDVRRAINGVGSFAAISFETPYSGTEVDDEPELLLGS